LSNKLQKIDNPINLKDETGVVSPN
jgi:hypothetical protein